MFRSKSGGFAKNIKVGSIYHLGTYYLRGPSCILPIDSSLVGGNGQATKLQKTRRREIKRVKEKKKME